MKKYILEQLRKRLSENKFSVSTENARHLLDIALKSAFDDENNAKNFIKNTLLSLNKLPDNIFLYRVVFVNSKNDINQNEIGSHFVLNRKQLEQSHQVISHVGGGQPFILTVKSPKNLIDVTTTLSNRVQYPHENEITLLNKGVGAKITNVEPFKGNDVDDEFDEFDGFDDFGY